MTLRYAEIEDETLKQKFKALVLSGQATGGVTLKVLNVNACVILRRDNFDHPFVLCFLPVTNLQSSLSRLFCHTTDRCGPPPCGRSSPPGHAVVDGWRRDERTRDIPQSLPRSLVSSAKPTTGVQVVRSAAPAASTRSLLMPTEQGLSTPGHDGSLRAQRKPGSRQGEMTPTREPTAPTYV